MGTEAANQAKGLSSDRIRIDEQLLRARVDAYLHSPSGRKVLQMFRPSFITPLFASVFGIVLGIVLLPTILGTRAGLVILRNVFALKRLPKNRPGKPGKPGD